MKSKVRSQHGQVRAPFRVTAFLLCPHMQEGLGALRGVSHEGANPLRGGSTPHDLFTSPKTHLRMPSGWGLAFVLGVSGGTNVTAHSKRMGQRAEAGAGNASGVSVAAHGVCGGRDGKHQGEGGLTGEACGTLLAG